MDVIGYLQNMNQTLDQFVWFKTYKFAMALYLVIMTVATGLMLYQLVKKAYFITMATGQSFPYFPTGSYLKPWKAVVARLQTGNPNEWKIAVIEAAELVNKALTTIQYPGKTLGEKLELMNEHQISNRDELKEALKVRNAIVQDSGYELTKEQAQATVEEFGKTLQFFLVI